ncbi:hypothetical protein MGA5115_01106 [Marinomonas gallaica]|uniref:Uncharacterized protein n=1 Tax=Marinomonas gallaica TaxID=1806667 RepID=A0A1C3JP85_9GAMM|nr:hypothetical protein MGA5115_01106 [Marinomonas gallaica]SBT20675.1 hypothetical protein MGA5116_01262 [Marinomonas gallaica]
MFRHVVELRQFLTNTPPIGEELNLDSPSPEHSYKLSNLVPKNFLKALGA